MVPSVPSLWRQLQKATSCRTCTSTPNLHKIVNNVRFLVFPWVCIEHLASKVLALNLRVLAADWQRFYAHEIALAETFVDTEGRSGS
jgi:hypothetical protein